MEGFAKVGNSASWSSMVAVKKRRNRRGCITASCARQDPRRGRRSSRATGMAPTRDSTHQHVVGEMVAKGFVV